jgi:nucleoside-diphosphate-sugar epimerase
MSVVVNQKFIKDNLSKERVALIGGAGFIGHNLAIHLRTYGAEVMVMDNLMQNNMTANITNSDLDAFRRELNHGFLAQRFEKMRDVNVHMRNADARSTIDVTAALSEFEPTKIVHLAAISSAVSANEDPGQCFDLQLLTLRNVLEYCRITRNKISQLVFMSSSTVYGNFKEAEVDENVRPRPYGIYASAKYMGERLIRTYNEQYGLGTTIIRPSALYGERCISRRVSQVFIENALMGKPLLLEGGGDGALDFTYIDDLVDGITRSMAVEEKPGYRNTFNITYGNARTIADLAAVVKSVIPNVILEERPRDKAKPIRGTLLTTRAKELLNFEPQWNLEKGYKQYCEWYVDQWERTGARMGLNHA